MFARIQSPDLIIYMKKLNTNESREIAELLKTIAHPVRTGILQMLHEGEKIEHVLTQEEIIRHFAENKKLKKKC